MNSLLLELANIEYSLRGSHLLNGISLSLEGGENIAVVGPNGSGKTTLLRIAAGLRAGFSGRAVIDGEDMLMLSRSRLSRLVSYVPQRMDFLPHFTVDEFLDLSGNATFDVVSHLVRNTRKKRLPELSGGELQRVLIAGGIAQGAKLLLLDEPTAHVDPAGRGEIIEALKGLHAASSVSCLIATHDMGLVVSLADRVVTLASGGVQWQGDPRSSEFITALDAAYGTRFIRAHTEEGAHPIIIPV